MHSNIAIFPQRIKVIARLMIDFEQIKLVEPTRGDISSGSNMPLWFSLKPITWNYEKITENLTTDILIIGGGISGLTTAYCLAKEGRKVVLVEDGFIGSGESGRTTAHITCALDDRYFDLENTFDQERAKLAADSHKAAIDWIANIVKLHKIDCHFRRVDGFLFLDPSDVAETIEKEYNATVRAGLQTEILNYVPFVEGTVGQCCIKFTEQGQFHILLYLKGLTDAILELGGRIYTQSKADNITEEGAVVNGFRIKANHIVVATNTPFNDRVVMHTKQWPYRTYVIGAKVLKSKLPFALWWDTGNNDSKWISKPYHYVRLEEYDEQYNILIAGGEDHRTGQADNEQLDEADRYIRLEEWTRKHFPAIEAIEFKWSGQVIEPLDSLAYLGRNPGNENIYIITGDSGNGITHGTLGGMIIKDIILGRKNPWIELYDPSRISLKVTGDYFHEVGNMVAQFGDWFTKEEIKEADSVKIGEGAIISTGIKKIAVYRDEENKLHACTAICPHLGGIVQWNADEKTFDCPLHGSRFTIDGKLINGPSSSDLKRLFIAE